MTALHSDRLTASGAISRYRVHRRRVVLLRRFVDALAVIVGIGVTVAAVVLGLGG